MRRQPKIFISYRADDDGLSAHLLYADLKARIGQQHLFMDLDALQSGDVGRFPALAAMRDCEAVLLLIGPRWMEPEKPGGSVLDPDDFVAGEIEEAQRLGKPILPVLLDHAQPPRPKQLPEKLWFLFKDRPLQFREESHRIDARLIEERVRPLVKGLKKSRRRGAGSPSWRRRWDIAFGLLAFQAVLFLGGVLWLDFEQGWASRADEETRSVYALAIDQAQARLVDAGRQTPTAQRKAAKSPVEKPGETPSSAVALAPVASAAVPSASASAPTPASVSASVSPPATPSGEVEPVAVSPAVSPAPTQDLRPAALQELTRIGALSAAERTVWGASATRELIEFKQQKGMPATDALNEAVLASLRSARRFEETLASLRDGNSARECAACPALIRIPGGEFKMGSVKNEPSRSTNEGPRRDVRIAPFAIGRLEITFNQWDACASDGFCRPVPSGGPRDNDTDRGWGRGDRPVIEISWSDVTGVGGDKPGFIAWLNSKVPGAPYRLPTEAEWEFAARAGTTSPFWWGAKISPKEANYNGATRYRGGGAKGEYRRKTLPVESFKPNPFGLYQVHGNVWEWVQDCWHPDYRGAPRDGSAWMEDRGGDCSSAVLRGGAWYDAPESLRAANRVRGRRAARDVNVGFRIARTLLEPPAQ